MQPPILLDLPLPIVTERLIIREPRVGEGAAVNAAVVESFAELNKWMPWAKTLPSVEDTETFTRESVAKFVTRKDIPLRMWSRDESRFIGGTGLHPKTWWPRVFEIGYWIRTSDAGQGLMTEAVIAIAEYGFRVLRADRIFIRCNDVNPASARVAEKAGFKLEGVMRNEYLDNADRLFSMRVYGRLPTD